MIAIGVHLDYVLVGVFAAEYIAADSVSAALRSMGLKSVRSLYVAPN